MSDLWIWAICIVGSIFVADAIPCGELRFRRAGRYWGFILRRLKVIAIVVPWGVCYHIGTVSLPLKRHERVHWEQYRRHGRIRFVVLYLIENVRRGYWNNKFEVEARRAEGLR